MLAEMARRVADVGTCPSYHGAPPKISVARIRAAGPDLGTWGPAGLRRADSSSRLDPDSALWQLAMATGDGSS